MTLCVFPIVKAKEIVKKYPLSIALLRNFLHEYMTNTLENEESASIITNILNTVKDFALLTLYSDPRKLYDFFDGQMIYVSVQDVNPPVLFSIRISKQNSYLVEAPVMKVFDSNLSGRANAELTGFERAFELLENELIISSSQLKP